MKLTLAQAMEMAESLTTDHADSLSTLGTSGDEVAILLHARVAELERLETSLGSKLIDARARIADLEGAKADFE